jgi:hypothetical protein
LPCLLHERAELAVANDDAPAAGEQRDEWFWHGLVLFRLFRHKKTSITQSLEHCIPGSVIAAMSPEASTSAPNCPHALQFVLKAAVELEEIKIPIFPSLPLEFGESFLLWHDLRLPSPLDLLKHPIPYYLIDIFPPLVFAHLAQLVIVDLDGLAARATRETEMDECFDFHGTIPP